MHRKLTWLILGSFFFIIADQFLKFLSFRYFQEGIFILGKFFALDFYRNYGVAFGLKMPAFLFYILIAFIIYFIFKKFKNEIKTKNFYIIVALSFIIIGAISNLGDRIFRGYVVDYLFIYPMSYFNLADAAILAGVVMIGFKELKH
ncbi:MAG: signal peptidase II [Patescibacteria group bacterium]